MASASSSNSDNLAFMEEIHCVFRSWRGLALNLMVAFTLLGVLPDMWLSYTTWSIDPDQWMILYGFIAIYLGLLVLVVFQKLPLALRSWIFVGLFYTLGIFTMTRGGLAGTGKLFLLIFPLLATMIISIKAGVFALVISLITMVSFGYLIPSGMLTPWLITEKNPTDLQTWILEGSATTVLIIGSATVLTLFYRFQVRHLVEVKGNASFLSKINRRLTEEAEEQAQTHEKTQLQLKRTVALNEVDKAIISKTDLVEILTLVSAKAVELLPVDGAMIALFDPRKQLLSSVARCGTPLSESSHQLLRTNPQLGLRAISERRRVTLDSQDIGKNLTFINDQPVRAFLTLPLLADDFEYGVLTVYHHESLFQGSEQDAFLDALTGQSVVALEHTSLISNLEASSREIAKAYDRTLEGWARALELRDQETKGHSARVTQMMVDMARRFNFSAEQLDDVRRGALLHDVGKMGIPDSILLKPASLNKNEIKVMRLHPLYAYEMLKPISFLTTALDIPLYHHEKWDGSGYPYGLKGESIPLAARIFAIIDVWDALIHTRPYKDAWQPDIAKEYLFQQSGTQFDPMVVKLFLEYLQQTSG